jgi:hypothetical protein
MKAWPSLTDTSVVKTYREVPALKTTASPAPRRMATSSLRWAVRIFFT